MLKLLFFLSIPLLLSSCTSMFMGIMGLKEHKVKDEKLVRTYMQKYELPEEHTYILDSTYMKALDRIDNKKFYFFRKDLYQPLQVRAYNKNRQLTSFLVNCHAGGFPNLKWNRNGEWDTVPMRSNSAGYPNYNWNDPWYKGYDSLQKVSALPADAPLDEYLGYQAQFRYIRALSGQQVDPGKYVSDPFIIFVFWSCDMHRQSKRLIRRVRDYAEKHPEEKIKIVYVNSDEVLK